MTGWKMNVSLTDAIHLHVDKQGRNYFVSAGTDVKTTMCK